MSPFFVPTAKFHVGPYLTSTDHPLSSTLLILSSPFFREIYHPPSPSLSHYPVTPISGPHSLSLSLSLLSTPKITLTRSTRPRPFPPETEDRLLLYTLICIFSGLTFCLLLIPRKKHFHRGYKFLMDKCLPSLRGKPTVTREKTGRFSGFFF